MSRRQLERAFISADGLHPLTRMEAARFPLEPRPPVHDRSSGYISEWRQCKWGGSPALQKVLSLHSAEMLYAYRRIWGQEPFGVITVLNPQGFAEPDWKISRLELCWIAHYLCGHPAPKVREQVFEVANGSNF